MSIVKNNHRLTQNLNTNVCKVNFGTNTWHAVEKNTANQVKLLLVLTVFLNAQFKIYILHADIKMHICNINSAID